MNFILKLLYSSQSVIYRIINLDRRYNTRPNDIHIYQPCQLYNS